MKKILLLIITGITLSACVNNCEYLFTEEREVPIYGFGGEVVGFEYIVEDVYECNTIVRDRRFEAINNNIEN